MGNPAVDITHFPERPLKLATNTDLEWLNSWSRDLKKKKKKIFKASGRPSYFPQLCRWLPMGPL